MHNISLGDDKSHAVVRIDPEVYSLQIVYSAAYILLDRAYFILDRDGDKVVAYIKPKDGSDPIKLGMEFSNELVNYASYSARVKENNNITRMIVQRALISVDNTLAKEIEDREVDDLIKELEKEDEPAHEGRGVAANDDKKQ
jgi:His-Xaa-Ser system protein HxsD